MAPPAVLHQLSSAMQDSAAAATKICTTHRLASNTVNCRYSQCSGHYYAVRVSGDDMLFSMCRAEIARLKTENPDLTHKEAFGVAAEHVSRVHWQQSVHSCTQPVILTAGNVSCCSVAWAGLLLELCSCLSSGPEHIAACSYVFAIELLASKARTAFNSCLRSCTIVE